MMSILLCAATQNELQPTIQFLVEKGLSGDADILITGVGLTATAYNITKQIATKPPRIVIQIGLAGSIDGNLELGQVVFVENEVIGDAGVEENENFKNLFDLNLLQPNQLPWENGKLKNAGISSYRGGKCSIVDAVSVNEISTNAERIDHYKSLGAQIESLEGAALHYVALMENIDFLQMRVVSNYIAERDKKKWMIDDAINNLNNELQTILKRYLTI